MYIYNCKHNNLRRFHDVLHVLKLSPFGLQTRLDGIGSPSENIINPFSGVLDGAFTIYNCRSAQHFIFE